MFTIFHNYKMLGEKCGQRGAGNWTDNSFQEAGCRYCSQAGVERVCGISLLLAYFLSEGGSKAVLLQVREGDVGDVRREEKVQTGYPGEQESKQGRGLGACGGPRCRSTGPGVRRQEPWLCLLVTL